MLIKGKLTQDQVKALKDAGLMIYHVAPRFRNVVQFPRQSANQEMPKVA